MANKKDMALAIINRLLKISLAMHFMDGSFHQFFLF